MQFLVFVLVMLMAFSASSQHVYYVKTDASPSSACPAQPCLTLNQYSSQASTYFTTGATFMFLAGNHTILTPIILKNVSHIAFRGEEADSVTVFCRSQYVLQCDEVANFNDHSIAILFANLTFQGNLTFEGDLSEVRLAGGAVHCNHSEVAIANCFFTGLLAIDGAAVSAHDGSEVTLDGNVFIQNKAIEAGGAIFVHKSILLLKETLGNTFASNSAGQRGGAIFCSNSSIVIERNNIANSSSLEEETNITESDDTKCTSTKEPLPVHEPHIHTTYFSNNKAACGGAMFLINSKEVLLYGTSIMFHNNSARTTNMSFTEYRAWNDGPLLMQGDNEHGGGAIAVYHNSFLSLSGTDIIFCRNSAHGEGMGGAIHSVLATVISNTKHLCFTGNTANEGGAYNGFHSSASLGADGTYTEFDSNHGIIGGAIGGAVYILQHGMLVLKGEVLFVYNHADNDGGGLDAQYNSTLLFSGPAINFVYNTAGIAGGAISIEYSHLESTATEVNFVKNWASGVGGGIDAAVSAIGGTKMNFIGNSAGEGAGMYIERSDCGVHSANMVNNTAIALGGAILVLQSNVSLHDVNVSGNTGGAVYVFLGNMTFSGNVKISRNIGDYGGGIKTKKSSINFKGNVVFEENCARENGGAIYIELETTILFSEYVLFNANCATLNGGAIFATGKSTSITLADEVHFRANWARNGGAMYFDSSASMLLEPNLKLTSLNNYATQYGGVVYNKDTVSPSQCDYLMSATEFSTLPSCFINLLEQTNVGFPYITSYNDSAKQGGSFLYGGLLDKCTILTVTQEVNSVFITDEVFYPVLMEHILNASSGNSYSKLITSGAYLLCFCESSEQYDCTADGSVETYRGRKFTVPLLALAEGNTVTSTPLRAKLSPTARLLPNQRSQYLSSYCTNMSYNLYSSEEQEQLIVYPDDGPCLDTGLAQAVINVTFLPCPDALTLSGDQCVCEERLQAVEANCTIFDDDFYITRKAGSKFWISALTSNGTYHGLILCRTCPIMYCKTESVNISLAEPDVQCDWYHSGVLCGACATNYSLMLSSTIGQACSNIHLALLFPFAAAGIALVVFLSFLRLTVATGMINSIILYANIVQANRNLLFPTFTDTNVLTVFIAWMNLDLGFQTCFYRGMDAYVQTWLQFAFPMYVWIIIACMIVTSRYSVTVTKLIGTNPIAVMATLLLMSYTKILKIIIEVYSSVELEYPGNVTSRVWLKDANVPYLQSKHLALMVVTTLVVVFFFLPYTLLLLLGYKLYHFTGRRHTRWLIRIKPLLDCYYAPYDMHTRYWTGFLLLIRCALYIVFSYDSLNHTTKSLGAIIMGFTALAVIARLSVKIYTDFCTNVIEALVYLDLVILSTTTLAEMHSALLVNSLVGVVFAIMMGIIAYRFHTLYIAKSAFCLKMLTFFTRVAKNHPTDTEASPLLCNSPTQLEENTEVMLREPLLTEN